MTVANRLRGAFAVYVVSLVGLAVFYGRSLESAADSGRALTEISERVRVTTTEQLARVDQMSSDAEKYLVTRDTGYRDKLAMTSREYGQALQWLDSASLGEAERVAYNVLAPEWRAFDRRASRLSGIEGGTGRNWRAAVDTLQGTLDTIRVGTQELGAASQLAMRRRLADAEQVAQSAARVSWFAAGAALVLSLLLSAVLARSIVRPLDRLAQGTREVSAGRFDHRLDASADDEFALVARDFNSMTERLGELDRMKKDFVAKVSHDLKTPLSSMQETISALLDQVAGPLSSKQRQLLELNLESGQRLSAMLGKLLDLSRIEADMRPVLQAVDVSQIAKRSVDGANTSAAHRGIRLSVVGPERPALVRGDGAAISQVLDNLVENAIKFSPADGEVQVSVVEKPAEGEVTLTVADGGPGIPISERDRVFERFYQTDAGRAVRGRGVGLGLAICREIVSAHGGRIWVEGNQPRGSVFHVLLRRSTAAVAALLIAGSVGCATLRPAPAARPQDLELRIATLTDELLAVRARLDSASVQTDSARQAILRLESTLRERDDQLQALRLELQRLKEIDLKPRTPGRRPPVS